MGWGWGVVWMIWINFYSIKNYISNNLDNLDKLDKLDKLDNSFTSSVQNNVFYEITNWTILSIEGTFLGFLRTFLISKNKAHFRFFPRNIGCSNSFSARHRMIFPRDTGYIRAFIKRQVI